MTEGSPTKAFTVDEANDLIPPMERVMDEIERLTASAERHQERLQLLDVLWGVDVHARENPDHDEFLHHGAQLKESMRTIRTLVNDEIVARGVRFPPGGLEHGLLDFPTTLDGRWVFLCWKRGEPSVAFWHEVSDGFAGRQPVTEDHARRMGAAPREPDS